MRFGNIARGIPAVLLNLPLVTTLQLRPRRRHITRWREAEVAVERGGRTLQHRAQLRRLRFFLDAVLDLGSGVVDGRPRVVTISVLSRLPLLLRVRRLYRWAARAVEACVEIKILRCVLNHRVDLHAIDATPARWRGDAGSSPLDRARMAASSPRVDLVKIIIGCTRHIG